MTPTQRVEKCLVEWAHSDRSLRSHVLKLLNAEHRAVVKMVTRYKNSCQPPRNSRSCDEWEAWYHIEKTCDDLLDALRRRKG